MDKRMFRIVNIFIENFKNVKRGTLDLENRRKDYRASIVGVYGQNGSGKTALIDALQVLKLSLCGKAIPEQYADYININAQYSTLKFQFKMQKEKALYGIWYQFSMRKVIDESQIEENELESFETEYKAQIFDEVLSFSYISDEKKIRKSTLIDTRTSEVFLPKSKYNELLEKNNEDIMELLLTKRLAQAQSRSFIFSREMINRFRRDCNVKLYGCY